MTFRSAVKRNSKDTIFSRPFFQGRQKGHFRKGLKEVDTTVKASRPGNNHNLTLSSSKCVSYIPEAVGGGVEMLLCICEKYNGCPL
jgi:hypothetical protein